jgi:hypothetical protein
MINLIKVIHTGIPPPGLPQGRTLYFPLLGEARRGIKLLSKFYDLFDLYYRIANLTQFLQNFIIIF